MYQPVTSYSGRCYLGPKRNSMKPLGQMGKGLKPAVHVEFFGPRDIPDEFDRMHLNLFVHRIQQMTSNNDFLRFGGLNYAYNFRVIR